MQHHLASSKRAGLTPQDWKALKNHDFASFADSEKSALIYAKKLTREPWTVTDDDITGLKLFFSEPQIVDLHVLAGLVNLTKRFTDPLGLALEMPEEKL
jgi:alkylhydroperoxidase family enzyme